MSDVLHERGFALHGGLEDCARQSVATGSHAHQSVYVTVVENVTSRVAWMLSGLQLTREDHESNHLEIRALYVIVEVVGAADRAMLILIPSRSIVLRLTSVGHNAPAAV